MDSVLSLVSLDNEITEANPQCWAGIIVLRFSTTFQFDLQDIRENFQIQCMRFWNHGNFPKIIFLIKKTGI